MERKKATRKLPTKIPKIKKRKKKERSGNFPLPETQINYLARTLAKQIDKEIFAEKYAKVGDILALVGAGAFLAASIAIPNLPRALKPFFNVDESKAWKRFNTPYLKRVLKRLEEQKLVETETKKGYQTVKITDAGRQRILKYSLDKLEIKKPRTWDGKWRLVSYDIPKDKYSRRDTFRAYLQAWGFYPLHESVFLHAYPCEKETEFLREYFGVGEYVRVFTVEEIEGDEPYREFFGV